MRTTTLFILAICVLVSPFYSRAGVSDAQRADYVQKTWGLASDGSDATQYFADKLNIQYNGIPFKDYVTGLVTANQLAAQLENKDYYGAARTATGYATDLSLAAIYQELEISGEVGVVSFSSGLIGLSLDYVNWSVDQDAFNEQCRFYFAAREQVGLSAPDILNGNDENKGVLFTQGWIYSIYSDTVTLSTRAGFPNNYTSAQFFAIAEQLYIQHKNQLALQADSQQIGQAFRQALQPAGPTFTTDLSNQTITDGQTAVFSVVVTGTGPFQYVWSVNGSALSGPYGSSFNATEAGIYQVTVYDANQLQAYSHVATLTVNPAGSPVALGSPSSGATVSGTCNVRASAPGATQVVFSLDGNPRYTDATIPFTWAWDTTSASDGAHQLVVTAYNGTTALGSSTSRTVTVNNSSSGNWAVNTYRDGSAVNGLADADRLITNTAPIASSFIPQTDLLGFNSGEGTGHFSLNFPVPGITQSQATDNYAVRVTGSLFVPASGSYTFALNTDDGGRLRIDGVDVIVNDVRSAPHDSPYITITLTVGSHSIEWTWFNEAGGNNGGGAEGEVFWAAGAYTSFNSSFALLQTDGGAGSSVACNDPNEPNDSSLTGTWLPLGTNISGYICTPTDVDWFRIPVTAAGAITVSLTVPTGLDFDLELYGPDLAWKAGSYNGSGISENITLTNSTPGFYYARVYGYPIGNGSHSTTNAYTITATQTTMPPSTLTNGLLAYYPLNGSANDASGNGHNGINMGAGLCSDRFGNPNGAFLFNGSNYVVIPDFSGIDMTAGVTFTAWVRPDEFNSSIIGTTTTSGVISKPRADYGTGYRLGFYVSRAEMGVLSNYEIREVGDELTNQWVFIAGTVATNSIRIYVNGLLQTESIVSDYPYVPTGQPLYIGSEGIIGAGDRSFRGAVNDVHVYNRALSGSEVQQFYSQESTFQPPNLSGGLVAYYPFNGNANDASGNGHDGTVFGTILTTNRFGTLNCAYYFPGNGERISVPASDSLNLLNGYTLAAWINFEVGGLSSPRIIDKFTYSFFTLNNGSSRSLGMYFSDQTALYATNTISSGQWYHVVSSYDLHQRKIYVNGSLVASDSTTFALIANSLPLEIGRKPVYGFDSFKGIIDDVRIYNRALSDSEVQQLYGNTDRGQIVGSMSIITQPASHNSSLGDSTSFSVFAADTVPLNYQWQRNGTDIPGATNATYTTPALSSADSGATYLVRLADSTTSALSAPAVLTVTVPHISNAGVSNDGSFQFDVITDDTRPHTVEVSTNLLNWLPISTNSESGGIIHISDATTSSQSQRFYRSVVR